MTDENVVNEIMLLIDGAIIHAQMGMDTDDVILVEEGISRVDRG
jgi:hypothetical protein